MSNELILSNLKILAEQGKETIIRFPVMPTINDTVDNISAMVEFLTAMPGFRRIDLLPYHKIADHKYKQMHKDNLMSHLLTPTPECMTELKQRFENAGFTVKIGG